MNIAQLLLLASSASAVQLSSKSKTSQAGGGLVATTHFMAHPIDIMLHCDKLQHDFKLDWDEVFKCINDAHMESTTFEGTPLTEEQEHSFHDDFNKHDANGDGLIDVYELLGFIDAHGAPCTADGSVVFKGLCIYDGSQQHNGDYVYGHTALIGSEEGEFFEDNAKGNLVEFLIGRKNPNDERGSNAINGLQAITDETVAADRSQRDDLTVIDTKDVCIQGVWMKRLEDGFNRFNLWGTQHLGTTAEQFWTTTNLKEKSKQNVELDWAGELNGCLYGFYGYRGEDGNIKGLGFKYRSFEKQVDAEAITMETLYKDGEEFIVHEAPDLDSQYVGCFEDGADRDLPNIIHEGFGDPQKCFDLAHAADYQYIGLQFSGECWAANSYGKYGVAGRPDSECNIPCVHEPTRMCGGGYRNSIYATGRK